MDQPSQKWMTRRALLKLAGQMAAGLKSVSAALTSPASPLADAAAVWEMVQPTGSGAQSRAFKIHGDVQVGLSLTGEDKAECQKRRVPAFAALFNGGWLEDWGPDFNAASSALTFALRLKNPSGEWSTPLFGQSGGRTRESFYLYASDLNDSVGMAIAAEIGSDEVRGMHRVRMTLLHSRAICGMTL